MTALAIVVVILATLLAVWAWLRPGSTAAIVDATGRRLPGSVATLERVQLGGVKQGLLIRGHDVANPVLLYLHGGPGTSELGMVRIHNMPTLERHYTVAVWDQRGAVGDRPVAAERQDKLLAFDFTGDGRPNRHCALRSRLANRSL